MEKILEIAQWFVINWEVSVAILIGGISVAIGVVSILVKIIPGEADDRALAKIKKFISRYVTLNTEVKKEESKVSKEK